MSWLDKLLPPKIKQTDPKSRKGIPEGLWIKCPSCEAVLYRNDVEANLHVCPKCDHHMRIGARERLDGERVHRGAPSRARPTDADARRRRRGRC